MYSYSIVVYNIVVFLASRLDAHAGCQVKDTQQKQVELTFMTTKLTLLVELIFHGLFNTSGHRDF